MEIERKFLVHKAGKPYKEQAYASSRITQGYICGERGRTVRVRIRDGRGFLTIKGASDPTGTARYEFEKEITLDEAQHLMKLCLPGLIDKTRYLVRSGTHVFEVDEFYGENDGLVMAEVELQSAGDRRPPLLQFTAEEDAVQCLARHLAARIPMTAASVTPVALAAKSSQSPLRRPPVQ